MILDFYKGRGIKSFLFRGKQVIERKGLVILIPRVVKVDHGGVKVNG